MRGDSLGIRSYFVTAWRPARLTSRRKLSERTKVRVGFRQPQRADLRKFHSGVEPRSVGAKQDLSRPRALDGLLQDVEATNARCVRVDVRVPHQVIDQRDLRLPVVGEAAQMRNDEIDVRVFRGQQFTHRDSTHHIV